MNKMGYRWYLQVICLLETKANQAAGGNRRVFPIEGSMNCPPRKSMIIYISGPPKKFEVLVEHYLVDFK